ncbi:MAG: sugar-transfer associated ATP-grasp domain-containing protein [Kiloniellales bacterium]
MRTARRLYGKSYGDLLRRFLYLCGKAERYSPREAFLWDLLGPKFADDELDRAMSKTALVHLQQRLNPPDAAALTEDKSIFYGHCQAAGLPIPSLLAVIGPQLGWTAEGEMLRSDHDWASYFDTLSAPDIVIKPALGVYAQGVRVLRRQGARWLDASREAKTSDELVAELRSDAGYDRFVVQERAFPHPRLSELSASDYLQTVRIITVMSEGQGAEIIFAFLKVIGSTASIDNFSNGATGNFLAPIDLHTGRLLDALAARPSGVGLQSVSHHPATGKALAGFEVPHWAGACALARKAAVSFLPLMTIGWDIALTPAGPLLIEGNAWWDPILTIDKRMHVFRDYARRHLEPDAFPVTAAPAVARAGGQAAAHSAAGPRS